jgi:hypothetical protein
MDSVPSRGSEAISRRQDDRRSEDRRSVRPHRRNGSPGYRRQQGRVLPHDDVIKRRKLATLLVIDQHCVTCDL